MRHYALCGLIVLGILVAAGRAQDGTFTASVDRSQLAVGEQLEITFTLNGSSGMQNFRPPSFTEFLMVSGPNQSTNMQFINGSMSSSISYSYILQPRSEGKFTIGPALVDYNGRQLQTRPLTITVTKGAPPQKQGQGNQTENSDVGKQIGDNLFLKVTVDKSHVVQGEQITATYKIYTRVSVANYNLTKVPSLTGFWSEDLDVPKQIQLTNEVLNGKQYRVGILKKVALFPQRSGTLEIDPMEVECVVQVQTRRRSNDIFDQFFNDPFFGGTSNVNYKIHSEPLKINVSALPATNVSEGFNGAVGRFSMEAGLDKEQTKTNEPVTLRVRISGKGNLKLLEPPMISIPPDLERYDPKISDNISKQEDQVSGSRTFEYLLIPRHAGDLRIPSFPFTYYDVEKKSYVKVVSPEFALNVEKGSEAAYAPTSGLSKEDVKLLGEDIRFIKSGDASFRRIGESFVGSPLFFTLSLSPILSFVGLFLYVKRRERIRGDVVTLRSRKARTMARRRLTQAKHFFDQHKEEEFFSEASRALWGYVADKLSMPQADLTIDSARLTLEQRGVSAETLGKFSATLEQCEFARFAPSSDSSQMESVYRAAAELISSIEDQIR